MIYFLSPQNVEGVEAASAGDCVSYFLDKPWISVDTETDNHLNPHDGMMIALQLGDLDNQFVIDFQKFAMEDLRKIKRLLLSKTVLIHNAKFDWKWLYKYGIDLRDIYDTFLAELVLTTGAENKNHELRLDNVVAKYTDGRLDKSLRPLVATGFTPQTLKYCADDVKYLGLVREAQLPLIRKYSLGTILALEFRAVRVLSLMEYNGVLVDKDRWEIVAGETENNMQQLVDKLDALLLSEPLLQRFVPDSIAMEIDFEEPELNFLRRAINVNWSSPAQKLKILKTLGIKVKDTDAKQLLKVRKKHAIVPMLLEYSKQTKLVSSFGRKFIKDHINPNTGKVHPDYFQIVSTGRISCSKPNLLNIPSHGILATQIRAAFVAKPGYKYVGGDYSGRRKIGMTIGFYNEMLYLCN